ncbi:DUF5666 domain-containing protein [Mycobacterium sp. Aquia_213]|uniref:DUF5666 domain-containing protein n=1 Tax=Mycobacterium sp. Aquia_213 TaxID=2991728 RepID=UPI002270051B|nr:DUF5666 domain-containing protein [Mycobacterium sp. Aquia_213]WAC89508.1 DUF5666 domain-containing protein [Mycobacterium sp. Aquia_213]
MSRAYPDSPPANRAGQPARLIGPAQVDPVDPSLGRWDHPTIGDTLISASSHRLTRFAMLGVTGVTALSVVACGSSTTSSPSSSPGPTSSAMSSAPPSTSPPATGQARVRGLIASVSGNTAQVTQEKGNAAVVFTTSTKVTEVTAGALGDVTVGSCVTVRPAHQESQPGQPLTAASVRVSPAVDGKCPPVTPGGTPKRAPVRGAVASVAGSTITVTSIDPSGAGSQTAVTVTDQTRYTKQAGSDTQAIAQGKCMTAQGIRDGNGTLQATTIDLRPARDGKCGGGHKPSGHRGLGG